MQLFWDNEDEILYFYDATNEVWIDISSGSMGMTGPQGITGPQGPTGPQGQTGSQGETGVQGETGYGVIGPAGPIGGTGVINFIVSGNGTPISTGAKGNVTLPFDLQIDSWKLTAGETGSILFGLWRSSYADYPPASANALHNGSTGPYIVDGIKNQDTDLSDWAGTTGAYGDHIAVNVDSVSSITLCSMALNFHRTV